MFVAYGCVLTFNCIKVFLTDSVSELYGQRLYSCDPGIEVMLPLQVLFSTTVTNKGREHVKLMMEYLFVYHPPPPPPHVPGCFSTLSTSLFTNDKKEGVQMT
jgi:hypothetical protein